MVPVKRDGTLKRVIQVFKEQSNATSKKRKSASYAHHRQKFSPFAIQSTTYLLMLVSILCLESNDTKIKLNKSSRISFTNTYYQIFIIISYFSFNHQN